MLKLLLHGFLIIIFTFPSHSLDFFAKESFPPIDFSYEISFKIDDIPDLATLITYRGVGNLILRDHDINLSLKGTWHVEELFGFYMEGEEDPLRADIIYTQIPSWITLTKDQILHKYSVNDVPIEYQTSLPTLSSLQLKLIEGLTTINFPKLINGTVEISLNDLNTVMATYLTGVKIDSWDAKQVVLLIINIQKKSTIDK